MPKKELEKEEKAIGYNNVLSFYSNHDY